MVVARFVAAGLAVPDFAPAAFDAAFAGDRFVVVVLFGAAAFAELALVVALFAALFDDELVDRAFFGELPFGSAFSIALPALDAAPPIAFAALVAAPPTTFPALVATSPTALPASDAATVPAALLTDPAALPTVFPTFLPALFSILPVSGILFLLVRPVVDRSTAVWPISRRAGARSAAATGDAATQGRPS